MDRHPEEAAQRLSRRTHSATQAFSIPSHTPSGLRRNVLAAAAAILLMSREKTWVFRRVSAAEIRSRKLRKALPENFARSCALTPHPLSFRRGGPSNCPLVLQFREMIPPLIIVIPACTGVSVKEIGNHPSASCHVPSKQHALLLIGQAGPRASGEAQRNLSPVPARQPLTPAPCLPVFPVLSGLNQGPLPFSKPPSCRLPR
jgi:hypothetical protein